MTLPDTNASLTHRHSHQTSIISNVNEQFVHNHGAQAAKAAHCEIAVWHEFGTSTTATAAAATATSQRQHQNHSCNGNQQVGQSVKEPFCGSCTIGVSLQSNGMINGSISVYIGDI